MPVEFASLEGRTLILKVMGAVDADDIVDSIHSFYSAHDFCHVIWDYRSGTMARINVSELWKISEAGALHRDKRGSTAKTVVICADEAEIRLTNALYAVANTDAPVPYKAFLTLDEAKAWLVEPAS